MEAGATSKVPGPVSASSAMVTDGKEPSQTSAGTIALMWMTAGRQGLPVRHLGIWRHFLPIPSFFHDHQPPPGMFHKLLRGVMWGGCRCSGMKIVWRLGPVVVCWGLPHHFTIYCLGFGACWAGGRDCPQAQGKFGKGHLPSGLSVATPLYYSCDSSVLILFYGLIISVVILDWSLEFRWLSGPPHKTKSILQVQNVKWKPRLQPSSLTYHFQCVEGFFLLRNV